MTNSKRLATVRSFLCRWTADQTGDQVADDSLPQSIATESLVIRDGFYCGRSFDLGAYRAIWFVEEDELKIRDKTGAVVAVFQSDEITIADNPATRPVGPDVIKLDTQQASTVSTQANSDEVDTVAQESTGATDDDDLRRAA
ncbi:MAG: hypothetical protein HKN47_21340 [Pirellulaceae bacterium]|nr:hypothetical protein [Pirellulaceae bacterium]